MTHRPRPEVLAAVGLVLVLGLVACGGSDDTGSASGATVATDEAPTAPGQPSSPAASSPSGGEQESQALAVTAVDFEFQVDDGGVRAGDVELTLVNDGSSTHDLVLERDGEDIAEVAAIDPGDSSTVSVTLEPGEYVLYCSIANHRAMGMEATIEVRA